MTQIPQIFERSLMAQRLATGQDQPIDFVTQLVVEDLAQRLAIITRDFSKALIIGPNATDLPQKLRSAQGNIHFERAATLTTSPDFESLDPENFDIEEKGYDLIVSLFDIAITNDVPGFLSNIRRHLAPDGLFLAAFIGGNSLNELRTAWIEADTDHMGGAMARVAPFIDTRDAGSLLQRAGFALPVADLESRTIRYASALALMKEIKDLGASNPLADRGGKLVTPAHLASACSAYENLARDSDGRMRATLEIIWVSGWAPHQSQQKPLAPGSAEVSLTKVLGRDLDKDD